MPNKFLIHKNGNSVQLSEITDGSAIPTGNCSSFNAMNDYHFAAAIELVRIMYTMRDDAGVKSDNIRLADLQSVMSATFSSEIKELKK